MNDFSRSGGIIRLDSTVETKSEIIMTSAGPTRTFAPRPDNVKLESELPDVEADWSEYYKNVRDAIDGKAELIVQPWQVRKVLKTIEAAFRSAETENLFLSKIKFVNSNESRLMKLSSGGFSPML